MHLKNDSLAMVYATLGNDDSFCQDYWIQPNGISYQLFQGLKPLLGEVGNNATTQNRFNHLASIPLTSPAQTAIANRAQQSVLVGSYCDYFSQKR